MYFIDSKNGVKLRAKSFNYKNYNVKTLMVLK